MGMVFAPQRPVTRIRLLAVTFLLYGGLLQASEVECAACHATDPQEFAASVHGFLACNNCHSGAVEFPHPTGVKQADCAVCHVEIVEQYAAGIHGRLRSDGTVEAPNCFSCHGDIHRLVSRDDAASPVHPTRLAETCGSCHANPELVAKFGIPIAQPLEAYRASIHARAVAEGRGGATCSDCHGSHTIFPAHDPRSSVFHQRVPETCGACHAEIAATYAKSVHGMAAARGVRDAPVCTDCHGEHRILSPSEPGSLVFATNIPLQTCGRCHSDIRLSEKYGLPLDKVPSYQDSYHGLAARAGVQTVANCASCHGVHDILPSSDPRSHVYPANLPQTCGQCHPGAGAHFTLGPVHVLPTDPRFTVIYYIRLFYLSLIYLVVGGMLLHNLLDFVRKARTPAIRRLAVVPAEGERMSLGFRLVHGLVMLSFSVLVYTGFALKYPESWWARPVVHWEASLGLRGWLHRAAAVVLLGAIGVHVIHLVRSQRARACIAAMRPTWHDWHEFQQRIRYYIGLRKEPPPGVKLGYVEKSEYWAFMWGTVIMAATGFLLWFENFTLHWFPKWMSDAATAVHFYEAILATLAILVWHFYWVIFDPAVYPMDGAWWTGRAPLSRALERGEVHSAPATAEPPESPGEHGETQDADP
ncbi:MAG: cytochrome c3 family protein [Chloroflexi bacterium]|nr:cytochrome c3 family protein [Chloroflexota bacterium]